MLREQRDFSATENMAIVTQLQGTSQEHGSLLLPCDGWKPQLLQNMKGLM